MLALVLLFVAGLPIATADNPLKVIHDLHPNCTGIAQLDHPVNIAYEEPPGVGHAEDPEWEDYGIFVLVSQTGGTFTYAVDATFAHGTCVVGPHPEKWATTEGPGPQQVVDAIYDTPAGEIIRWIWAEVGPLIQPTSSGIPQSPPPLPDERREP